MIRNPTHAALALVAVIPILVIFRDYWLLAAGLGAAVFISVVLADIDWRTQLLPNRFTAPLAAGSTLVVLVLSQVHPSTGSVGRALLVGIAFFLGSFVLALVANFGMGDVKYSYSIGLAVGWFGQPYISLSIFAAVIFAALVLIGRSIRQRGMAEGIAFGPFMAAGQWVALLSAGLAL